MSGRRHIVIVDDEPGLRDLVTEYLTHEGFAASAAADGAALRRILAERAVDLVLLDITMPGEDGLTLARYLREHHRVGIIMLTAKAEVVDRIIGLEVGADDYLTKPFDLRELLARVRSVLRRTGTRLAGQGAQPGIRFGYCMLNLQSGTLHDRDGREVPLTPMELALLKAFAQHPNQVLDRDRLLDLANNRDWEPFDRSIDVRIARLRRKIEADPANPQFIKTVRGAGYMFVPAREA